MTTRDVFLESAGKAVLDGTCIARTYAYGDHHGKCRRKAPAGGYCWQHANRAAYDDPPRRPGDLPGAPCETYGGTTP